MNVEIIKANYSDVKHGRDIEYLLAAYALDPMGGGRALASEVIDNIVKELAKLSYAFSLIAYVEGEPAALLNGFEAFSTFACKPLINIHDVVVLDAFRGKGISQRMLAKVEEMASSKGCCKITLEVLSNNVAAKAAYLKYGFSDYELGPQAGTALFWQKKIEYT
ncbi:Histone acetyltransferase HPA2 and related acetyltransferases [hydrothermal vent metagenome]|uniref:Histone acetyltransferase HPA2 and related acetyltransferases n=1 Tax=hydrothermal vent metagenome TaxID=652676 RepID=A0A3B0Y2A0_9ZZZZ